MSHPEQKGDELNSMLMSSHWTTNAHVHGMPRDNFFKKTHVYELSGWRRDFNIRIRLKTDQ